MKDRALETVISLLQILIWTPNFLSLKFKWKYYLPTQYQITLCFWRSKFHHFLKFPEPLSFFKSIVLALLIYLRVYFPYLLLQWKTHESTEPCLLCLLLNWLSGRPSRYSNASLLNEWIIWWTILEWFRRKLLLCPMPFLFRRHSLSLLLSVHPFRYTCILGKGKEKKNEVPIVICYSALQSSRKAPYKTHLPPSPTRNTVSLNINQK